MIWPNFFAAGGRSLPTDQPLPVGVEQSAHMAVVRDEVRAEPTKFDTLALPGGRDSPAPAVIVLFALGLTIRDVPS